LVEAALTPTKAVPSSSSSSSSPPPSSALMAGRDDGDDGDGAPSDPASRGGGGGGPSGAELGAMAHVYGRVAVGLLGLVRAALRPKVKGRPPKRH
jgi:hypothetical protein